MGKAETATDDALDAARVYVGNLKPKANETHITEAFARFGAIVSVWVARKPPGFAFVAFERESDALRAVQAFDDAHPLEILGKRVKVQLAGEKNARGSQSSQTHKERGTARRLGHDDIQPNGKLVDDQSELRRRSRSRSASRRRHRSRSDSDRARRTARRRRSSSSSRSASPRHHRQTRSRDRGRKRLREGDRSGRNGFQSRSRSRSTSSSRPYHRRSRC